MASNVSSRWVDADAYEAYIGRWSRVAAREFVDWLAVPSQSTWLDVGCGPGGLTQTILERCDPARIEALDVSQAFIAAASRSTPDSRASFRIGDACALPCTAARFDAVVSGLMLNSVPNQADAISEFSRAAKSGAVVGTYVWDFDGEMQMLRYFWDAANALAPDADQDRDASGFEICKPDRLAHAFRDAGFRDVEVRAIDAQTRFRDFEDYWTPFLRGGAPAQAHVASLSDEKRRLLRDRIKESLPTDPDGSIPLIARAWAAKGIK